MRINKKIYCVLKVCGASEEEEEEGGGEGEGAKQGIRLGYEWNFVALDWNKILGLFSKWKSCDFLMK